MRAWGDPDQGSRAPWNPGVTIEGSVLIVTPDGQRDNWARTISTMRTTASELEGVSHTLCRSAEMSPDGNTRERLPSKP